MDARVKERMLKILALAREGVGGEQENAERMLNALCRKHGVTVEQLEATGSRERVWFYVNTKHEKSLLFQCYYMCVGACVEWWKHPKRSRAVGFDLTPGERAQLTVAFETFKETFKEAWHKQLDAFFVAFVWKNRIYGLKAEPEEEREQTEEEKARLEAAQKLVKSIERTHLHKRIEG